MDTNRTFFKACIASMMLVTGAAAAQTIYKQVDENGRVMFTDQPSPAARVVTSFETARDRGRASADRETSAEPNRPETAIAAETMPGEDGVRGRGDVERAVFSNSILHTPLAAQADANEAARRSRQQMQKPTAAPVLTAQAAPREHGAAPAKSGMDMAYIIWAATFFVLAAGLLYVGWQVIRLTLGVTFPRWELGQA